jgi:hypothetical protein
VAWSSRAFRQIGLDRIYTEQFTIREQSRSLPINPAHSANVIAEITGREKPDDFIVVTSHLDSGDKLSAEYESAARISNDNSNDKQNAGIGIAQLKKQVGIAAITAFAIADAPERIGPRLSRSQTETLLGAVGWRTLMQSQGLWNLWASGARGRTLQ